MKHGILRSIPREKRVHGVRVRKLPIGAYLAAAQGLRDMPKAFLAALFPGKSFEEGLLILKNPSAEALLGIVGAIGSAAGPCLVNLLGLLLEESPEALMERLTPTELLDVLEAFWEVNELGNFTNRLGKAVGELRGMTGLAG